MSARSTVKTPKLPEITEKVWQKQVEGLAKTLGYRHYHPYFSMRSAPGYPDLTLISPSQKRVIWIELKTEKGKVTNNQQEWLDCLAEAGQEVYVFRPSDFDRIVEILRRPLARELDRENVNEF